MVVSVLVTVGVVRLSNETLLKIFELFNVLDTDGSGQCVCMCVNLQKLS